MEMLTIKITQFYINLTHCPLTTKMIKEPAYYYFQPNNYFIIK